jgi:hypothetical protein
VGGTDASVEGRCSVGTLNENLDERKGGCGRRKLRRKRRQGGGEGEEGVEKRRGREEIEKQKGI